MKEILHLLNRLNKDSFITHRYFLKKQLICLSYMLVFIVSSVAFPGYVGIIIDEINLTLDSYTILFKCLIMLAVGIVVVIANYQQRVAFTSLGKEIAQGLKEIAYAKVLKSNNDFWNKYTVGEIYTIIDKDIETIEFFLSNIILGVMSNLLLIIGLMVYITYINVYFGIILLMLSLFFCFIYHMIGRKAKLIQKQLRYSTSEFLTFVNETLNNICNIQMIGYEDYVDQKYKDKNNDMINKSIKQIKIFGLTNSLGIFFNVISVFIILFFGTKLYLSGLISIGAIFNLILYTQRIYSPMLSLTADYLEIKKSMMILKKMITFLDDEHIIFSGTYSINGEKGTIVFKDVDFNYQMNRKAILSKFNYTFIRGQIVGIVGENGSGKSTIMKLITKSCQVRGGDIYIDDYSIDLYDIKDIRNKIGCMPQDSFILSGRLRTILDPKNIYSNEEIIDIAKDFTLNVENFQDGLDTLIGENNVNLSGGEAQKISLIRLILENKIINILDEPTSEIDMQSEMIICNNLPKYVAQKTLIIITHRSEILRICEKVINLNSF